MSFPVGFFQIVKRIVAQQLADFEGAIVSSGAITATSVTDTGLTSGRVVVAGAAGLLADDADLTFSGSTLTMTQAAVGSGGLAVTGAITATGGLVATTMTRVPNVPIGSVAYGSLGTNTTLVAGTQYFSEILLPANKSITGAAVLNGATVGADNGLVFLCNDAGTVVATSALAGAATAGANAFQQRDFTAPYAAVGPGRYWLGYQSNGTTDTLRTIAASTFLNSTGSAVGVFGTVPAITPTTTTTADVGPVGYLY